MSKENHEAKKAAAAALNAMSKANSGRITPQQIVDAARDEGSALHPYFEWDDGTAAEQYRLMQARTLLRSCQVEVEVENHKVRIPAYVRDPEIDRMAQGYVETARLRTDADLRRDALLTEFARAGAQLARARRLAAYFDAAGEVDKMIEQLGLLKARIEGDSAPLSA
jgi:hypothetical protein